MWLDENEIKGRGLSSITEDDLSEAGVPTQEIGQIMHALLKLTDSKAEKVEEKPKPIKKNSIVDAEKKSIKALKHLSVAQISDMFQIEEAVVDSFINPPKN